MNWKKLLQRVKSVSGANLMPRKALIKAIPAPPHTIARHKLVRKALRGAIRITPTNRYRGTGKISGIDPLVRASKKIEAMKVGTRNLRKVEIVRELSASRKTTVVPKRSNRELAVPVRMAAHLERKQSQPRVSQPIGKRKRSKPWC